MSEFDLRLETVLEIDASKGRALVKGLDANNRAVRVELSVPAIRALLANLQACEAELLAEATGAEAIAIFFYGGAELRKDDDRGYAVLVMKAWSNQKGPQRSIGFRMSAEDLSRLGSYCSDTAPQLAAEAGGKMPS